MFKGNSKPQEKNLGLYKAPYRRNQLSNFERTVFGIISLQENVTHMEAVCEKVGCCDKSIRSHIGLENLQFCVVSLVTLQTGTFEHLATQYTMLQNPYFFCLFSSKRLYISQCQQYTVIAYLCNN